ncbi:hypothetical protein GQ44DRAFT_831595 [Phaeosphaeriaceae sp. PMI808]|nr:hypothetical protein GQ44DRAFT_831595 [Phaeosphaeriaceae sp. PMI808]
MGSVVDIHRFYGPYGNGQHAGYPPDYNNQLVYKRMSNKTWKYSECEKELTDGRAALTMPRELLVIPPGWLHLTVTIIPGCLFGSTFAVAEGVVPAAEILNLDLLTYKINSLDELGPFLQSLHAAIVADYEEQWLKALISSKELQEKCICDREIVLFSR